LSTKGQYWSHDPPIGYTEFSIVMVCLLKSGLWSLLWQKFWDIEPWENDANRTTSLGIFLLLREKLCCLVTVLWSTWPDIEQYQHISKCISIFSHLRTNFASELLAIVRCSRLRNSIFLFYTLFAEAG
jgi:hypothetical protein